MSNRIQVSFSPDQIMSATQEFKDMMQRFEWLGESPLPFTRLERVEYDLLGGMFATLRDLLNAAAEK